MRLIEAIQEYLEPTTGAVGLKKNPHDNSTDNLLLFTATYLVNLPECERELERDRFIRLVRVLEIQIGCYKRYLGHTGLNSHDDLQGVAIASYLMGLPFAGEIVLYGFRHDWSWNTEEPGEWTWRSWLARILGFVPLLRHCARLPVGSMGQITLALAFLVNMFEPKEETSGKCLLWLRAQALTGHYPIVDLAIKIWKLRMIRMYPGGLQDVYRIYFKDHPFTDDAPSSF